MESNSNYKTINSFFDVELKEDYLLVIDIDDTILAYEGMTRKWWKEKMDHYLEIHDTYEKADNACINNWKTHIENKNPCHTDKDGFFDLISRAKQLNLEYFIVTARDKDHEEITHEHLNYLGIIDVDVYFTSGEDKSQIIHTVMSKPLECYKKIVFIDDLRENLDDVKDYFGDENVVCYKFKHSID